MKEELKFCPFCLGGAKLHTRQLRFIGQNCYGSKKIRMGAQVVCSSCRARGPLYTGNCIDPNNRNEAEDAVLRSIKQQAIDGWNHRW